MIAQGERIVGEGWHRKWGEPHAEVRALQAPATLRAAQPFTSRSSRILIRTHAAVHRRADSCRREARRLRRARSESERSTARACGSLQAAGIAVSVGLLEDAKCAN